MYMTFSLASIVFPCLFLCATFHPPSNPIWHQLHKPPTTLSTTWLEGHGCTCRSHHCLPSPAPKFCRWFPSQLGPSFFFCSKKSDLIFLHGNFWRKNVKATPSHSKQKHLSTKKDLRQPGFSPFPPHRCNWISWAWSKPEGFQQVLNPNDFITLMIPYQGLFFEGGAKVAWIKEVYRPSFKITTSRLLKINASRA